MGKDRNFTGQHFWARGYFVSTVGCDEIMITEYIRAQETEDQCLEPSQEPADHLQVVPMPLVSGPT